MSVSVSQHCSDMVVASTLAANKAKSEQSLTEENASFRCLAMSINSAQGTAESVAPMNSNCSKYFESK